MQLRAAGVASRKVRVGEAALEFARDLATKAAKFAAEVERLHAQRPDSNGEASASGSAGAGEAA